MAKKAIPLSELPIVDTSINFIQPYIFNTGAVILMDKPLEWSSFQVVKYVRNRIPAKKVGHAGTLDPLATGLLVLCSGKATKSISQIQELNKTYVAHIRLGASTPSFDAALETDQTAPWKHIILPDIQNIVNQQFTGEISQVPPIYSAIKVKGKRLYKLARRGEQVEIEPRNVVIHDIKITECSLPDITLTIKCGKGTYIRSLAHDLGIALGSRGYLTGLRRTKIGHFDAGTARTPHEFDEFMKQSINKNEQ
ncbi:MAG: tRNA pseudouridine(55) synthase TruB [Balneolaceae bacterium]